MQHDRDPQRADTGLPQWRQHQRRLGGSAVQPTQREGAAEAFRGFINLFDDYLAPQLMAELSTPVDLIWGEKDPWEPIAEARCWRNSINCVRSLNVIPNAGHCPHDEAPDQVNPVLQSLISSQRAQQAT